VTFSIAFLTLLPWTIRNYLVFDKIVPVRAAFGDDLLKVKVTVDSDSIDLYKDEVENSGIDPAELERQIASMQNKGFLGKVQNIIFDNPGKFLKRYSSELVHFWIPYPDPDRVKTKNKFLNTFTKWMSIVSFGPVLIFGMIGT